MSDPHAATAALVEQYLNLITSTGERHGVSPALIAAVIHDESGGQTDSFRVECLVCDASFGLMMLLLGTVRGLGYFGAPRYLFDPAVNIELGTQYLAGLIKSYGNPWLALVAYNGGPGAVRWYRLGWTRGKAVHYANVVHALELYYERRFAGRPTSG